MKCTKDSIDGQSFIACSTGKLTEQDYQELKKYIQFRKDRYKKKVKNEKHSN